MIGAEVVFLVAHMQPTRSSELSEVTGEDIGTVSNALTRAWRNGYLVRKDDPENKWGGARYVYALAPFGEGEWC